jgi:hypothetical protein
LIHQEGVIHARCAAEKTFERCCNSRSDVDIAAASLRTTTFRSATFVLARALAGMARSLL